MTNEVTNETEGRIASQITDLGEVADARFNSVSEDEYRLLKACTSVMANAIRPDEPELERIQNQAETVFNVYQEVGVMASTILDTQADEILRFAEGYQ